MPRSSTKPPFTENDLQVWLNDNLSSVIESFTNLDEVSLKLQEHLNLFHSRPKSRLIDHLGDVVRIVLDSKILNTLTALTEGSKFVRPLSQAI